MTDRSRCKSRVPPQRGMTIMNGSALVRRNGKLVHAWVLGRAKWSNSAPWHFLVHLKTGEIQYVHEEDLYSFAERRRTTHQRYELDELPTPPLPDPAIGEALLSAQTLRFHIHTEIDGRRCTLIARRGVPHPGRLRPDPQYLAEYEDGRRAWLPIEKVRHLFKFGRPTGKSNFQDPRYLPEEPELNE